MEVGMEDAVVERGGHFGGLSFGTFLFDALMIFLFVVWFWLLIRVVMDLFRRRDMSGLSKVLWVIALLVVPYIGIFAYLVTQGASMAREQMRHAVGFSAADEIEKLDRLKAAGSISEAEYQTLRARLI
jgi:uncharacterized membrane protein